MTAYREAMLAEERTLNARGSIEFANGRVEALSGADVVEFSLDEGVEGGLLVGAVLSGKYKLTLANAQGEWLPGGARAGSAGLLAARVRIELGVLCGTEFVYCPAGSFVVEEIEGTSRGGAITVTGYDEIYQATAVEFVDGLNYPKSLREIFSHLMEKTTLVCEGALPNGNLRVASKPNWGTRSVRQALACVLALAGAFLRVNRAGAAQIVSAYSPDAQPQIIAETAILMKELRFGEYGPVNALKAESVPDAEGEGEQEEIVARLASGQVDRFLRLEDNPLLVSNTAQALLNGALSQIGGLRLEEAAFHFRGDPTLEIGDLVTAAGKTSILTRQSLRWGQGFYAECTLGVPDAGERALRAITPDGALNAAKLVGALDGGLLLADSVRARAIAAGSVTAEKIAAGSVTADKLDAETVDAHVVEAVTGRFEEIAAEEATTDRLYAGMADIIELRAREAALGTVETDDMTAAVAQIADGRIGSAAIGYAQIRDLISGTAIIEKGVNGKLYVANLAVTEGNIAGLTVGELIVRAADGSFRALVVDENGNISTELKQVSNADVADGTLSGTKLIENAITARELNVQEIFADAALIGAIKAANIDVGELFASEAAVSILNTYDIRNDDRITLTVGGERKTYLRVRDGGVEIGQQESFYKVYIASDRLDILQSGVAIASFSYNKMWTQAAQVRDSIELGNYMIRKSADGGLAFGV